MKFRWIGLVAAAVFAVCPVAADAAAQAVPEDVYQWVQSTSRQNYFFNKQQIYFLPKADGTIDLNRVEMATLRTYDDVQVRDIIAKRRWKGLSTRAYGDLAASADYIELNLAEKSVILNQHDDLDSGWGVIGSDKNTVVVQVAKLSEQSVERKFMEAVFSYIEKHRDEILERTERSKKMTLSAEDKEALEKAKNPVVEQPKDQKADKKHKKDKKKK